MCGLGNVFKAHVCKFAPTFTFWTHRPQLHQTGLSLIISPECGQPCLSPLALKLPGICELLSVTTLAISSQICIILLVGLLIYYLPNQWRDLRLAVRLAFLVVCHCSWIVSLSLPKSWAWVLPNSNINKISFSISQIAVPHDLSQPVMELDGAW
jgi:hypothetical protein